MTTGTPMHSPIVSLTNKVHYEEEEGMWGDSPNVRVTALEEVGISIGVSTTVLLTSGAPRLTTLQVRVVTETVVHYNQGAPYRADKITVFHQP